MHKIITFVRLSVFMAALALGGCAGTMIDATSDAAIALAKVPFKVGAAAVDVITDDD